MKGCDTWASELSAFVDGELAQNASQRLEVHLPGCEACRTALDAQCVLQDELTGLPSVETSPGFEARFWARLAKDQERQDTGSRFWRLRPAWSWGLGAAAALAAMLLFFVPAQQPIESGPGWVVISESDEFELVLDSDPQLLEMLDILEELDES